jgi:hypothetical protein
MIFSDQDFSLLSYLSTHLGKTGAGIIISIWQVHNPKHQDRRVWSQLKVMESTWPRKMQTDWQKHIRSHLSPVTGQCYKHLAVMLLNSFSFTTSNVFDLKSALRKIYFSPTLSSYLLSPRQYCKFIQDGIKKKFISSFYYFGETFFKKSSLVS